MTQILNRLWLIPTLRGIFAIIFGLILFCYPGLSLVFMIGLFGAFLFISGLFTIIFAWNRRHFDILWKNYMTDGVISLIIGLIVWVWPTLTSLLLVYLIAIWALISGLIQIATALRLRRVFANIWLNLIMGILLVAFGVAIFVHPGAGAVAIALVIGIMAIVYGIVAIGFGLQLRKAGKMV